MKNILFSAIILLCFSVVSAQTPATFVEDLSIEVEGVILHESNKNGLIAVGVNLPHYYDLELLIMQMKAHLSNNDEARYIKTWRYNKDEKVFDAEILYKTILMFFQFEPDNKALVILWTDDLEINMQKSENDFFYDNISHESCPGAPTVTDIDGNIYNTVLIGTQCWMKENLRVKNDPSGNPITRYCYANSITNCRLYGGLYKWETIMNNNISSDSNPSGVQGICPIGWHLPSNAEWKQLVDYIVNQGYPNNVIPLNDPKGTANALKSCRQINSPLGNDCNTNEHPRWNSNDMHYGTDVFGFSGLPGGYRHAGGTFIFIGSTGYFWSSLEQPSVYANYWYISNSGKTIHNSHGNKTDSHSVRCIKD